MSELAISYDDVVAAAWRLRGVAHRTPVLSSRSFNERCGGTVFFKCESFQRTGAFKFRGAYNALSKLSPDEAARGVVAYSSGNHAQAMALAGKLLEIPVTIVMPDDRSAGEGRRDARLRGRDRHVRPAHRATRGARGGDPRRAWLGAGAALRSPRHRRGAGDSRARAASRDGRARHAPDTVWRCWPAVGVCYRRYRDGARLPGDRG